MSYLDKLLRSDFLQVPKRLGSYFEGWYFKHEYENSVFALIPGLSLSKDDPHAFVQLILSLGETSETRFFRYPLSRFDADRRSLYIKVGENKFTKYGVSADFSPLGFDFKCKINYGRFTPLKKSPARPSAMGLFSYLPHMECNHQVISLRHRADGFMRYENMTQIIKGGLGYIEKDWGRSFPSEYFWIQCNNFGETDASFMLSAAAIPMFGKSFLGFICIFHLSGKQYVFATYNFSSIEILRRDKSCVEAEIKRGRYKLTVSSRPVLGGPLAAPLNGKMNRTIKECVSSDISLRLEKGGQVIFCSDGKNAGFEQAGADNL